MYTMYQFPCDAMPQTFIADICQGSSRAMPQGF